VSNDQGRAVQVGSGVAAAQIAAVEAGSRAPVIAGA
jgi:hypothetical protein